MAGSTRNIDDDCSQAKGDTSYHGGSPDVLRASSGNMHHHGAPYKAKNRRFYVVHTLSQGTKMT
ncbi:hypothetical protein SNOG_13021 [Parastagonospora nodorum SN15]|uniref:Uncharacterized protein n=1 Tax=Phaeosphaeria nodorum (strain SN15 / ATCC MYA-4574 / FGSC 10173) TaxID=321614 RepID=Q0U5E3_PHANO|nr:hypothetical protein SNOG_13021 [Parastagonospora nodorum SN15]EAT79821.1 hypothetical protein SNOG_13021 [Parastagonospora nodorum SN15]